MFTLPAVIMTLLNPFAPVFDRRTWEKVQVLTIGAILSPGKRTVSSALGVMGLDGEDDFSKYHQVLNRAVWSPLAVSRILLRLVVNTLCAGQPLVVGIDEHIERRRGKKISAKGIYRDAVRSSDSLLSKPVGCAGSA